VSVTIQVEVVFALPDRQLLLTISLVKGATVADAIRMSGLGDSFPDARLDELQVGVWGRPVDRTHQLQSGDRVEIYRSLEIDPREARRQLALLGRTMRDEVD